MRSKASSFLKQMISVITSVAKAKSLALKNKTSAIKTRLIIFSLLRNKKVLLSTISHKLHALLGQEDRRSNDEESDVGEQSKAIVLHNINAMPNQSYIELVEKGKEEEEEEEKYPDLTHSLFDSDDLLDFENEYPGGSVIDLVRNSKEEGEEFKLEDEIDHVADLFIRKFHRQMRMQKQLSFKMYQEMLERSV